MIRGIAVCAARTRERWAAGTVKILVGGVAVNPGCSVDRSAIRIIQIMVDGVSVGPARSPSRTTIGIVVVVVSGIAVGVAPTINPLGFGSGADGQNCGGDDEFYERFHGFDIVVFGLFSRPVIGQLSPTSSQSSAAFLQLLDALTDGVILVNLMR